MSSLKFLIKRIINELKVYFFFIVIWILFYCPIFFKFFENKNACFVFAEEMETCNLKSFLDRYILYTWNFFTDGFNQKIYHYKIAFLASIICRDIVCIQIILFLGPLLISLIISYWFFKYLAQKLLNKKKDLLSIIFSILYSFSPYNIGFYLRNWLIHWEYAILPILFYFIFKILIFKEYTKKDIVIFAIIFSIVIADIRFTFIFLLILSFLVLLFIISRLTTIKHIFHFISGIALAIMLSLMQFLPMLIYSQTIKTRQLVIGFNPLEGIRWLPIIDSFTGIPYHYLGATFDNIFPFPYIHILYISLFLTSLIIFILFYRKLNLFNKKLCCIFLLTLLFEILLSTHNLFLYSLIKLICNLQASSFLLAIIRLAREGFANIMFINLFYFLIIFIILSVMFKGEFTLKKRYIYIGLLLIFPLLNIILLYNSIIKYFNPSKIPKDYIKVREILHAFSCNNYSLLILPHHSIYKATWVKATSINRKYPPSGEFVSFYIGCPTYNTLSVIKYPIFDFIDPFGKLLGLKAFYMNVNKSFIENFVKRLNIRYILIHTDISKIKKFNLEKILNEFIPTNCYIKYKGKYVTLFECKTDPYKKIYGIYIQQIPIIKDFKSYVYLITHTEKPFLVWIQSPAFTRSLFVSKINYCLFNFSKLDVIAFVSMLNNSYYPLLPRDVIGSLGWKLKVLGSKYQQSSNFNWEFIPTGCTNDMCYISGVGNKTYAIKMLILNKKSIEFGWLLSNSKQYIKNKTILAFFYAIPFLKELNISNNILCKNIVDMKMSFVNLKYKFVNPTLWKIYVNTSKPFLLVFAEAYDPLWEARIYKDEKLVEKVGSIPVYGVINGFWINQTGNLTIIIRYVPQDWFELGLKISGTTFLILLTYLIIPEIYWRKLLEKLKSKIKLW